MEIGRREIVEGLGELGLREGSLVLVHSSLAAFGRVSGGAQAVVDALVEAVGEKGTLVMPWPLGKSVIARVFSEQEGIVESRHPTHNACARGPLAAEITAGHRAAPTACGEGTPYGEIAARGGYILLLGVDQDRNTTLHTAEDYADLPYLSDHEVVFRTADGAGEKRVLKRYPGPHRDFIAADRIFRDAGVMRVGRIGRAAVRLIEAGPMVRLCLERLRTDPAFFLCPNPACADCLSQRGKIHAARLAREDFILVAPPGAVGDDLGEALESLSAEGIGGLEVSGFGGRRLEDCPRSLLEEMLGVISGRGFRVEAVDAGLEGLPGQEDRFRRVLEAAVLLGCGRVVLAPAGPDPLRDADYPAVLRARADEAAAAGITLLVENRPGTAVSSWSEAAALLEASGSPHLGLAFNPAGFARAGEKPFLQVPPGLRRRAGLVYVNDALFAGPGRLPGEGNAEIKEIISILRCAGYGGLLSLRPETGPGLENFRAAAAAFRRLLETM